MVRTSLKARLNYPRYTAPRPLGAGAFFDFACAVASREVAKLESCKLRGAFRSRAMPYVQAGPEEDE